KNDVSPLRTEGHFDRPGELGNAAANRFACFLIECNDFGHVRKLLNWLVVCGRCRSRTEQGRLEAYPTSLVLEDGEDVFLTHQQQFLVAHLEGFAGPGGE